MRYVVKRLTDGQYKTNAERYSNGPRWTVDINLARIFGRKSDAVQSVVGSNSRERYPRKLIEIVPVEIRRQDEACV